MKSREISRIAMITATLVVGRLLLASIPNVQPMTTLIVLYTLVFGKKEGVLISVLSLFISNLYLGLGPWTIGQVAGYTIIVLGTVWIEHMPKTQQFLWIGMYLFLAGILYGSVMAMAHAVLFGWNILIPYFISGIPFDLMHSVGNIVFLGLLYPMKRRVFERMKLNAD